MDNRMDNRMDNMTLRPCLSTIFCFGQAWRPLEALNHQTQLRIQSNGPKPMHQTGCEHSRRINLFTLPSLLHCPRCHNKTNHTIDSKRQKCKRSSTGHVKKNAARYRAVSENDSQISHSWRFRKQCEWDWVPAPKNLNPDGIWSEVARTKDRRPWKPLPKQRQAVGLGLCWWTSILMMF